MKFLKSFLVIVLFLAFNIVIDALTGVFIPGLIAVLKTGDFLKSANYMVYGLLAGQLVKLTILAIYMDKRDKTFYRNFTQRYIKNEKLERPLRFVGIGLGTVGFGLLLTNIIMKAMAGTELLTSALNLMENAFNAQTNLDGLVLILTVAVGAPIVEELLFRGVLFEELNRFVSVKTTIFLTALIFSLYHFNILQSPNTFVMGLVLAWTYYKTRSIKASIIIHATNNILALIPIIDQGLSPIGIGIYIIFMVIGLYSLKTLRQKA